MCCRGSQGCTRLLRSTGCEPLLPTHAIPTTSPPALPLADAVPGLHGLKGAGSYLSMDTDGRVIRVDSFAKFLAPGACHCALLPCCFQLAARQPDLESNWYE